MTKTVGLVERYSPGWGLAKMTPGLSQVVSPDKSNSEGSIRKCSFEKSSIDTRSASTKPTSETSVATPGVKTGVIWGLGGSTGLPFLSLLNDAAMSTPNRV